MHESVGAVEAAQPWERGRRSGARMLSLALLAPSCNLPPGPLQSGLLRSAVEGQQEPSACSHGPGGGRGGGEHVLCRARGEGFTWGPATRQAASLEERQGHSIWGKTSWCRCWGLTSGH